MVKDRMVTGSQQGCDKSTIGKDASHMDCDYYLLMSTTTVLLLHLARFPNNHPSCIT